MSPSDFWLRLARFQARSPWLVLMVVAIITTVLASLGSRLTVTTGFEHMLPDGRESVLELNRVAKRTAGVSTLFVVIEAPAGTDRAKLREASTKLTADLRAIGDPWVGSADNGVHSSIQFFEKHGGLYAEKSVLDQLSREIEEYYQYQVQKELGTLLDESEPPPKPPLDREGLAQRFGANASLVDRYPGGYFESQDGLINVVVVRSKILGGDVDRGSVAIEKMKAAVEQAGLSQSLPGSTRSRPSTTT